MHVRVCGWGYLALFWQEKFVNADKTLFDDVYKCKKNVESTVYIVVGSMVLVMVSL